MNFRESLKTIMNFENPRDLCQYEWGYWPDTLKRWREEGMPEDEEPWEALGITFYHRVSVEPRFYPAFAEQVIADNGEKIIVQDKDGIIKEVFKNTTVFPKFLKHPVQTMQDFTDLEERLDPHSPGRFPPDWTEGVAEMHNRNSILVMGGTEISFFGWPRALMGLENLLVAYYDQPELIHAINRQRVTFVKELYAKILKEVEFDYIFMWEDMCYRNGPLISPRLFREFMLPYYKEIIGFFKGITECKVLVDSDGDVTQLIQLFIEAGVDGILPFEVAAGMDICKIRQEHPDLLIAGGIDKREIAKGKQAIDRELESRLPPMFEKGGYCPSLDHHVPPEVGFEDFKYYLEKTRQIYERCR